MTVTFFFPALCPVCYHPCIGDLERYALHAPVLTGVKNRLRLAPLFRLASGCGHRLDQPDGRERFIFVANHSEHKPHCELHDPSRASCLQNLTERGMGDIIVRVGEP
jgi:hypothetical protein